MKTKHIFYGLLALLLVACNDDDYLTEVSIPDGEGQEIQSNPLKMTNPYYWWANNFPGDVPDSLTRVQDYEVTIDGNYKQWTHLKINTQPTPWVSTGLYLPVAEKITVEVPEGLPGLKYRIGVWHCLLPDDEPRKRYSTIWKTGELQPGVNELFNYFGGHLYITFSKPLAQSFSLKVSGAVKSPDFILGKTDPESWKKEVAGSGVPYAEMIGKRMILTMPVTELRKVADPQALMEFYDEFVDEDYNKYAGMSDEEEGIHQAPTFPWRYNVDIQLCVGAGHNGYPFVGGLDWAGSALSLIKMQEGDWGTYHELGHNYQTSTWKWGALGEVSNNLHVYHMVNRKFGKMHPREIDGESAVKYYVLGEDPAMVTWDFDTVCKEKVFWGLVPFLQIAQEYGWPFYAYLARKGRENGVLGSDEARRDFFARRAAEYANANLAPFFDAWRIAITPQTRAYIAQFPKVENRFWETFDINTIGRFEERMPVVKKEPRDPHTDADRTGWQAMASSQRPTCQAAKLLDGETKGDTFWQSDWANASSNHYPHWVVIDMQKSVDFNYIYLQYPVDKQSQKDFPRKIQIAVSDDNQNWTVVKNGGKAYFYLSTSRERQTFYVEAMSKRYLKIDMLAPHAASGQPSDEEGQKAAANLSELGVGIL